MPTCSNCNLKIDQTSPVATYENKSYHPDCLKCSHCFRSLSGKQFIKEKNGDLVCEECNIKVSPKCSKCNLHFGPGQTYKRLGNEVFFHNECFVCCGPCGKPIAAEFYDIEDNKHLCTECYDKYGNDYDKYITNNEDDVPNVPPPPIPQSKPPQRKENPDEGIKNLVANVSANLKITPTSSNIETLPAVQREQSIPSATTSTPKPVVASAPKEDYTCAKCKQQISGTFTVYNEKKYHTKCFVCCQCNQEFKEKTFFKLDNQPLCRTCHSQNLVANASSCRKCSQPILDTVVTFKGGEYHDYCLVCNLCSKKLVGQSIYTDKQEKPYCIECFTKKEAKICNKCSKSIAPNQTNLVFEDKNFHKECFTCKKCSKQISSAESFYRDKEPDTFICEKCA